ncbi:hypothetical protein PYJP_06000 [Pyrofollis japonicus]|uniref:hypothetical protein n=1 Tax=Pyrofollis japonicus TaxID=3060460 RepID=UPI00295AC0B0|nr:hypothetical protein [Pyrofollis japonicus]BEP17248.1 hypothetical protein PYJP_06000 [Pyrofollis japonicus]
MAQESRERLREILEAIVSKDLVSPGDVVVETGLPRYLVLAAFQCLEALGIVEPVFTKGSYKVYTSTIYAKKLLKALQAGEEKPVLALLSEPSISPINQVGGEAATQST